MFRIFYNIIVVLSFVLLPLVDGEKIISSSLRSPPLRTLLSSSLLSSSTTTVPSISNRANNTTGSTNTTTSTNVYKYNICNGLSNQLLYHAASIAIAIEEQQQYNYNNNNINNNSLVYDTIVIPNHYIINGEQTSNDDIYPYNKNSIPLLYVFDQATLIRSIKNLVSSSSTSSSSSTTTNKDSSSSSSSSSSRKIPQILFHSFTTEEESKQIPCAGMNTVAKANPHLVLTILQTAFRPSTIFQSIIQQIQSKLQQQQQQPEQQQVPESQHNKNNNNNNNNGICIHHRDGKDWHEHCKRWSNIKDGVYRGNCLSIPNESFIESIYHRAFTATTSTKSTSSSSLSTTTINPTTTWIYYCGDHEPPQELTSLLQIGHSLSDTDKVTTLKIYTRHDEIFHDIIQNISNINITITSDVDNGKSSSSSSSLRQLFSKKEQQQTQQSSLQNNNNQNRDLFALIDFFVCASIPYFIGNSVSTFSALQIALRNTEKSYWYNSQSIPLATMVQGYSIPIVYTYTEHSKVSGKYLLQASITSVRKHMPFNPIHILYDGTTDHDFIQWLHNNNVQIHSHDPVWRVQIEQMRLNGNAGQSNLFLHPGNYFGTWQRIDIPLYIESEYCLLLDADTIVRKPFTIADFGYNMTRSIALSAEGDQHDERPWNAGVMLMNIPYLRKTHTAFISYILDHIHNATFNHPAPSDQGAYLAFYHDSASFLDTKFNFKPYWKASNPEYDASFIIHFHGAKPHDYIQYNIGKQKCDEAIQFLCTAAPDMVFLCSSILEFAQSVNHIDYCSSSFPTNYDEETICYTILATMNSMSDDIESACNFFNTVVLGKTLLKQRRNRLHRKSSINHPSYNTRNHYHHTKPLFNSLFRWIPNYKLRRFLRITVSWVLYVTFVYSIWKLYILHKQQQQQQQQHHHNNKHTKLPVTTSSHLKQGSYHHPNKTNSTTQGGIAPSGDSVQEQEQQQQSPTPATHKVMSSLTRRSHAR